MPDLGPVFGALLELFGPVIGAALKALLKTVFGMALLAGRRAANRRPSNLVLAGFALLAVGVALTILQVPRADSGWDLAVPLIIAGCGLGLMVSQLNNYTLSPVSEERASEAAGVNSAAGSFGLSFGLAFAGAIMLATLAFTFTRLAQASTVLTPAQQEQVAVALEEDAEVMSNTQLEELLVDAPPEVQEEIIRINTEARPPALQVALLVPLLAGLIGLVNSLGMRRLPDPTPSAAGEMAFG